MSYTLTATFEVDVERRWYDWMLERLFHLSPPRTKLITRIARLESVVVWPDNTLDAADVVVQDPQGQLVQLDLHDDHGLQLARWKGQPLIISPFARTLTIEWSPSGIVNIGIMNRGRWWYE